MSMHKILVVQIVSCQEESHWYFDMVGYRLEVIDSGEDYILLDDHMIGYGHAWRHIEKVDCEVLSVKDVQLDS